MEVDKNSKLRVLGDNVLLFPYEQKQTKSGIVFSKSEQNKLVKTICVVSTIGKDVKDKELEIGDMVMIPRHTGKWVPFQGERYILVKEDDILAVIEGLHVYAEE